MADNLKDRGAQDRSRVNIHEEHEVRCWTEKWGVTKDQLAKAAYSEAKRPVIPIHSGH
jgi:hypothetical protein